MLDKSKIYVGYSTRSGYIGKNQPPARRFRRIRILFEDDISYYVESLVDKDKAGFGLRFSVKKHCFRLIAKDVDRTPEICKTCPLHKAFLQLKERIDN